MQNEKGYDLAGRSIFIALPAYDFKVSLKLAISLARFSQLAPQHGISIQIGSICGCSVVSRARNLLVQDLLDSECTDLMFIDADINFEAEDILRLLAWTSDPKKGIVAGVPRTRSVPKTYITTLDYDDNEELTLNGAGLVRAKRVATAFMMVRRDVFETLDAAHPEWRYYDERTKRDVPCIFDFMKTDEGYIGEDYLFCDRARDEGYEVWIDPTIKLGHMGVQEYEGNFGPDVLYPMIVSTKEVA
jgi:hypothetical protein|tara:strand:- start:438 stop:1172 length:735 start_codon:yes stop_codon:yes gene_type:complete